SFAPRRIVAKDQLPQRPRRGRQVHARIGRARDDHPDDLPLRGDDRAARVTGVQRSVQLNALQLPLRLSQGRDTTGRASISTRAVTFLPRSTTSGGTSARQRLIAAPRANSRTTPLRPYRVIFFSPHLTSL